jgi:hypothetical protein
VEPFRAQLTNNKMTLINLGKQVEDLAVKREIYLQNARIMYNESFPAFENHILSTTRDSSVILKDN